MTKLRAIFMGTPDFAVPCLEVLAAEHEVLAVVTQPDRPKGRGQKAAASPVKEAALRHGLPIYQPEKIKTPEFTTILKELQPDIMVVVAFGQLLSPEILAIPPLGCINVHASLLPKYRGAAPIHWAIVNGETMSGVTTMYMDKGMDTGDMILTAETAIAADDTTALLHDRLQALGSDLLRTTLQQIAAGTAPRQPQDHTAATYASLLTKDIEKIDWTQPAVVIHNLVRGLNSWPGAFCTHREKRLKVWRTEVIDSQQSGTPGRITRVTEQAIYVETGRGILAIYELQPESKRRMPSSDYEKGYGPLTGEDLL